MAQYTAIFTKPYADGYENLPSQNTPITAQTLNDKDNAIVNIETYLSGNDIPSDAEGLSYDNTDSGLTADNVQSAIDEIVTDIPTVNNGTLTIQKNGVDVQTFSANQSSNATANIQVVEPDSTIKTNTTGQFNTITGGLFESCVVTVEPVQSGSGTPSPDNVRPITGHTSVEVDVTDADSNTTQYTVALGQTVYGGSLDVVSGVLTIDKGYVDMGSFNYTYSSQYSRFQSAEITNFNSSDYALRRMPMTCSCYQVIDDGRAMENIPDGSVYNKDGEARFYVHDSRYTSSANLKTALSGQQLVFPVETPVVIQLTPQQIETLIGQNNVSVPLTGQSLDSLSYREVMAWDDVEKGIEPKADKSSIGTEETGATASKAYTVGEHFLKDGKFCTAIASISSGATLTLNTNYVEGTIAENFDIQDVKSEFTFNTDCTWDNNWTKIYKVGSVIIGCLRFIMPSTVSSDKIIITAPSKYQCKDSYRPLSPLSETWTGANNGIIGFSNNKTYIRILSTTWTASKNVIASFEYPIG